MWQETPGGDGGLVAVRGRRWRVVDVVPHEDCEAWRLAGVEGSREAATLLVPFDRPRRIVRDRRPRPVGRRRWMASLAALAATTHGYGQLRAAAAASIDLHPYQLEPVVASLGGALRILVADEVGLGKTIQAGLVISELAARGEADRVLVLAPAGLCAQWRRELAARFHLSPVVVDAAGLRGLARWPSLEGGPWQRVPLAVASLDFVKRPEVLRGMSPARYDLLVVDEAHLCARARERGAAVGWLAKRSRRVLLLTATPDDGDPEGFEALRRVGELGGEPLVVFRRTRLALGSASLRRVHLVRVRLSPAEEALQAQLARYTARVWRARAGDPRGRDARLAMVVLRKRAASGPTALLLSLQRRLQWLSASDDRAAVQLELPLGCERDLDDEDAQPDGQLAAPGLDDAGAERRALDRLVSAARLASARDAKLASLLRILSRARQPAVVFTEYRDTLDRLAAALASRAALATLHGGMDAGARDAAVRAFNDGQAAILLATDAAAHGLNLQSRCRLVVNMELPWSPVRLEQRIGRLDRIGQRRKVHAFNLVGAGTCEDRVIARLVARIDRARRCLGSPESLVGRVGEEQVAEAVFEGRDTALEGGTVDPPVVPGDAGAAYAEAARLEALRLARERLLLIGPGERRQGAGDGPGRATNLLAQLECRAPWMTRVRRRRIGLAPGLWCVCRVSVSDALGRPCDQRLLVLQVDARPSSIGVLQPLLERLAIAASAGRVRQVASWQSAVAAAAARRERALAAVDDTPPAPVQPGLFDRRALAEADRNARRREEGVRALTSRLHEIARAARVGGARAELLLVLAVPA